MIELKAEDLILEYAQDVTEANRKYAGQQVKVTGELFYIGESNGGRSMILFRSPGSTRLFLGAYFQGSWNGKDELLVTGTPATVEGILKEKDPGDIIEIDAKTIKSFYWTHTI